MSTERICHAISSSSTASGPRWRTRISRMFGHVIPISCSANDTSDIGSKLVGMGMGVCRPENSHLQNAPSRCIPKLSKNCWKPSLTPAVRLLMKFSGSAAMSLTTCSICAMSDQKAPGGIPTSRSSPLMIALTGSSMNSSIAAITRPMSPPPPPRASPARRRGLR